MVDFHIPVHVMNLTSIQVNLSINVAFVLSIGDATMWAGTQTFTIDAPISPPTAVGQCKVNSVSKIGVAMAYQRHVLLPQWKTVD